MDGCYLRQGSPPLPPGLVIAWQDSQSPHLAVCMAELSCVEREVSRISVRERQWAACRGKARCCVSRSPLAQSQGTHQGLLQKALGAGDIGTLPGPTLQSRSPPDSRPLGL